MKTRASKATAPRRAFAIGFAFALVSSLVGCADIWGFDDLTRGPDSASPAPTTEGGSMLDAGEADAPPDGSAQSDPAAQQTRGWTRALAPAETGETRERRTTPPPTRTPTTARRWRGAWPARAAATLRACARGGPRCRRAGPEGARASTVLSRRSATGSCRAAARAASRAVARQQGSRPACDARRRALSPTPASSASDVEVIALRARRPRRTAPSLLFVHGAVGTNEQCLERVGIDRRGDARADAHREVVGPLGGRVQFIDVSEQASAGRLDAVRVRVESEHGELVAPEPRDDVRAAERSAQDAAGFSQDRVAPVVPERVVDLLQAIEVDEEERDGAAGPPGDG